MTADTKPGIAVVGTGIGRLHAQAIHRLRDRATLRWICSLEIDRAHEIASISDTAQAAESLDQVLADEAVQAVILSVPTNTHVELAEQAFAAGKHVMVEKPIGRTLAEAIAIISASQQAGKLLMVGHNQRYYTHYRRMKEALETDAIGNPVLLDAKVHVYGRIGGFRALHGAAGGGTLIDSGVHKFDLFRWMLGEVESVSAFTGNVIQHQMEDEDIGVVQLVFRNGVRGSFVCSWSSMDQRSVESVSVYGAHGSIHGEDHSLEYRAFTGRPGEGTPQNMVQTDVNDSQAESMYRLDAAFVEAIAGRADVPVTGYDGAMALALVEAAYASARTGTVISMTEFLNEAGLRP